MNAIKVRPYDRVSMRSLKHRLAAIPALRNILGFIAVVGVISCVISITLVFLSLWFLISVGLTFLLCVPYMIGEESPRLRQNIDKALQETNEEITVLDSRLSKMIPAHVSLRSAASRRKVSTP